MSRLAPPEHESARRARGEADAARLVPLAQAYLAMLRLGIVAGPSLDAAWRAFFAALDPTVLAVARACRWPEADLADGAQEAWIVIVRRLPGYRPDPARGPFRAWIVVLVRRSLANARRGRAARPLGLLAADALAGLAAREEGPAAVAERSERAERVRGALAAARAEGDPAAARAARLYWAEGRTAAEVAAELGRTPGQVWNLLRRARHDLATRLAAESPADRSRPEA